MIGDMLAGACPYLVVTVLLIFVEWDRAQLRKDHKDDLDHELTASPQCSHSARTSRTETLRPRLESGCRSQRGRRRPARLRLDQLSKQDQLSPASRQGPMINRGDQQRMLALVRGRTAYRSTPPTMRLARR